MERRRDADCDVCALEVDKVGTVTGVCEFR